MTVSLTDARREEEERLKREKEAAMAAEAERLAQEKLLRLPPKFHFCVAQVGWKMGNPPETAQLGNGIIEPSFMHTEVQISAVMPPRGMG